MRFIYIMSYELMRVTDNEYININSIDDIADFGKLSEPLFKLVRTIEPNESGLIILPNDIISLFRCLFIGIEDYIDLIIAEFYAPLIERSKELTVS